MTRDGPLMVHHSMFGQNLVPALVLLQRPNLLGSAPKAFKAVPVPATRKACRGQRREKLNKLMFKKI
jgi:hypothetical protein